MPTSHWTPRVSRDLVLSKCRYFVDTQLWPTEASLDPRGWLSNFPPEEELLALHLLNSFFYYSTDLCERLFVAAITNLSQDVVSSKQSFVRARREWQDFLSSAYFVRVTGEKPTDADSGYQFTRMARQTLRVDERRIVRHEEILRHLLLDPTLPVIFVDDFVGSGDQFMTMWHREYKLNEARTASFQGLTRSLRRSALFYCPLIW